MTQCRFPARGIVLLAPAIAMWLATGLASGAVAESSLLPYISRTWRTDDGLPQNAVTSVLQTKDGYIWVGTYSGLARFDGVHFQVFNSGNTPALRSGRVTSLFEDPAGTLWIGSEIGELTACDPGRHFRAINVDPALGRRKIIAIALDERRDMWLVDAEGMLMRLKDGLRLAPKPGGASSMASSMAIVATCPPGNIWVLHHGGASTLEQGRLVPQFGSDASDTHTYVQGICSCRQGGIWVARDGLLQREKPNQTTNDYGLMPWGVIRPLMALLETSAGLLAAGTEDQGLFIVQPGGAVLNLCRSNGLPTDWISCLCEDREGNLWIGTGGNGLIMVRRGNVTALDAPDQWQGRPVLSMTSGRNGTLWVGTEGAGLYRWQDGQWSRFGWNDGVHSPFVWSICEDAGGRLWVGTWGGDGLLTRRGERFDAVPAAMEVMPPVTALFCSEPDELWAGTGAGLLHYQAGKAAWLTRSGPTPLSDVRCVVKDNQGTVWFGMLGGGLGRLDKEGLRLLHKSDGLSSDFIQFLHPDNDGSLWIGTSGGGLNRLKEGHFSAIGTAQGLSDDTICWMEDDGLGYFWVSSHAGIMRLSKRELNQCADGKLSSVKCLSLGKGDGLSTLEFSGGLQPAGCKTAGGRLCFASNKGVVEVDPRDVPMNTLAPPVVIEALKVDGNAVAGLAGQAENRPLRIPPGRHRLAFVYTGLSFTAPEKVRFRYRLEGVDSEWTEAGGKRSADYDYLSPGQYVFHVLACNNSGVWNDQGASLAFVLMPFFWQTWWFRALLMALALGLVGAGVWLDTRRRMRRKMEALERQQAVEHERARIARDIHDELGSHLTRITMLSEPARHEPNVPHPGTTNVRQIHDIARELTRTMDEIVWAVNPHHDTPEGLASYLEQFALPFLGVAGVRCRLDMPLQLPLWPLTAETRHNVFLAFKEALHNTVKHSGASEVRIALTVDAGVLTLSVEDNGRGFDPAGITPDGNGLGNMRRRLEEIGGRCEVVSAPGQGVKIKFIVLLREAPQGFPPGCRRN
jgi:signal transduction histidine kinase/ligand-binding sensor domain-containing protein